MYKAILFDMDGVILDTEKIFMKCWEKAGKEFGLNIENKHLSKMRGGTIDVIKNVFESMFGTDIDFYTVRNRREVFKNQHIEQYGVPVKEGVEDLLKYIKQNNIKTAVATSTTKDLAFKYLKQTNLYKYFDQIVCGDMIKNGKPAPDIYLEACKRLEVLPKDCLVFEDSRNGIWAGHNAGCDVAMVVDIDETYEDTEDKIVLKVYNYEQAINFLKERSNK